MAKLGKTTARGYGAKHQAQREQWRPTVDAGEAYCTEPVCLNPDRWIEPGSEWHLAHDREASVVAGHAVYRGPSHAACNTSEGSRYRHGTDARSSWRIEL